MDKIKRIIDDINVFMQIEMDKKKDEPNILIDNVRLIQQLRKQKELDCQKKKMLTCGIILSSKHT